MPEIDPKHISGTQRYHLSSLEIPIVGTYMKTMFEKQLMIELLNNILHINEISNAFKLNKLKKNLYAAYLQYLYTSIVICLYCL